MKPGPLHRFFQISPADRWYLIRAAALMLLIKIALKAVPFKRLYSLLNALARPPAGKQPGADDLYRVLTAVDISARYTPLASTCLTQALTGKVLLARSGIPADLQIGVGRGTAGQLEAHAWVVHQGKVVIGDRHDLSRYQVFTNLKESLDGDACIPTGERRKILTNTIIRTPQKVNLLLIENLPRRGKYND